MMEPELQILGSDQEFIWWGVWALLGIGESRDHSDCSGLPKAGRTAGSPAV